MARAKVASMPEVGQEAPEFNLPSAQGGQLRLSMRTARGPVVVVFYRGPWAKEDVDYFKALAAKEDEINLAAASIVGIGVGGPDEARDFVQQSGIKSYVLYDYAKVASREWGTLEKDKEHGEYACPAVFIVGADHEVVHAWTEERPGAEEILTKVSEITGLPKPDEEGDEEEKPKKPKKPKKAPKSGDAAEGEAPEAEAEKPEREKPSPEDRDKRRTERQAARESEKPEGAGKPEETAKADAEKEPEKKASEQSSEEQETPRARTEDEKKAGE